MKCGSLKRVLAEKPWLLVVFGMGFLVALSVAFVVIAVCNPPHLVR